MFKVGDIVIGLPYNGYRITGSGSICEVQELLSENRMTVKLIQTKNPYVEKEDKTVYNNANQLFKVSCNGFTLESERTNKSVVGLLRKGDAF